MSYRRTCAVAVLTLLAMAGGGVLAAPRNWATPPLPAPAPLPIGQHAMPAPTGGYPYLLHLPAAYNDDADARWPVIIFLHGSGERGTDINLVKVHGPPQRAEADPAFPFIVISPQLPASSERWGIAELDATLDAALAGLRADRHRLYLTGLSLGGMGSWDWAIARPGRFAAVAPVAARGDPAAVCAMRATPVWVFHGDSDPVVPRDGDITMVRALEACGAHPRLSIFPATGHNSWDPAYSDAALYLWFLSQRAP